MKISKYYWFVIATGLISGLIVFGGQVLARMGFSLYQISTLPYFFSLTILSFFIFFKKIRLDKKVIPLIVLYGLIESGIITCQFAAPILGASVAVTVLLLYIQPLWTALIAVTFLREKLTAIHFWACLLVVIGVLCLINPFDLTNTTFAGSITALLGGIFLSGWLSTGSFLSKKGVGPVVTMFYGNLVAFIIFMISLPFARLLHINSEITGYSFNQGWIAFLAVFFFGVITYLVNHYLYLKGIQKVPTMTAGIIMLLEPIVGAILAAVFLKQPITLGIVIGGFLILLANYFVIRKARN